MGGFSTCIGESLEESMQRMGGCDVFMWSDTHTYILIDVCREREIYLLLLILYSLTMELGFLYIESISIMITVFGLDLEGGF